MAHATYDAGNPYGPVPSRPRLRGWVIGLPLLLGLAGAGYALLSRERTTATVPTEDTSTNGWRPQWQPAKYEPTPPPAPPATGPDRTQELLKELLAQQEANKRAQDALRKELAELRKRPATQASPAVHPKAVRKHTPMLMIEHAPTKTAVHDEDLYWLGAGTWIPCTVEPRLNSDVPGHFTVKTRVPMYDTKTGQRLLIQQNQPIVAKDDANTLLFGNTRMPTFALTLSNPDGSSVDLGEMPITDHLGTNGLTSTVNNHMWRLVWTSLFLGGLRGGQQALQAGLTTGDPTGAIAGSVAGQLSQTGQHRLGRAQDTRPTIEVHSGSLCNVLLTKALQLPAIPQSTQARR